jgi:hypothetical protein
MVASNPIDESNQPTKRCDCERNAGEVISSAMPPQAVLKQGFYDVPLFAVAKEKEKQQFPNFIVVHYT